MNLKRSTVALASAVLVALVGPAGAALAAGVYIERDSAKFPLVLRSEPFHEEGEERERKAADSSSDTEHSGDAEQPGEQDNPGEVEPPGESENPGDIGAPGDGGNPSEHGDSGDEGHDHGGSDPCAVAAGPVSVCVDQPK